MNKTDISVGELLSKLNSHELGLPELQRRYVWTAPRVRDLFDSLYRGYPSGAILVWETDRTVPERELAVEQQRANVFTGHKLLLDGQQRLTSLSAVIEGKPLKVRGRKRPIDLGFNVRHPEGPPVEVSEVDEDAIAGEDEPDEGSEDAPPPSLNQRIKNRTFVVWSKALRAEPQWVKVSDIFTKTDYDLLRDLGVKVEDPEYDKLTKRLQAVRRIKDYPYAMYVLERDRSYEEVTEIFVRVNSKGVKLRGSDLALAMITSRWQNSLKLFEDFAEECADFGFELEVGLLVRTLVAFATGQSRFRTLGGVSAERLKTGWEQAKNGLRYAMNLLAANGGVESEELLSSPLLVIPVAVYAVRKDQKLTADEERMLLRWLFLANTIGHYSASSETTLDVDLRVLFKDGGPIDLIDVLRQESRLTVEPTDFARKGERNPLFAMTYLAARKAGAKDWWSGLKLSLNHAGKTHRLQAHHIFPRSLLRKAGYDPEDINEIANLAFVGGATNLGISNKTPSKYLAQIREKYGEAALEAHCIPVDEAVWTIERFPEFLERRRALLAKAVNAFLSGLENASALPAVTIEELIAAGESTTVEFKETTAFEGAIAKSVAGFMNAQGGTLLIGVTDEGDVVGIGADVQRLKARNGKDAYVHHVTQLLLGGLPKERVPSVKVSIAPLGDAQVCRVDVPPAPEPVFIKHNGAHTLFVRVGNLTKPFDAREQQAYVREHFRA